MNRTNSRAAAILAMLSMILCSSPLVAQNNSGFEQIATKHAAAIVTVKYVLAVNMGSAMGNREQESESETSCVMISSDGQVICSNNQLTGFVNLIQSMAGPMGGEITAIPRDISVILDEDPLGFEAEIVAVDSDLDIAWLQIGDTRDTQFKFVDFAQGVEASRGDEVFIIKRMGNHFGRTAVVTSNYIGGATSKPRQLLIPHAPLAMGGGLPVFNAEGSVIGLMITQIPDAAPGGGSPLGMMGAGMSNLQDAMSGLILPAAQVTKATINAQEE